MLNTHNKTAPYILIQFYADQNATEQNIDVKYATNDLINKEGNPISEKELGKILLSLGESLITDDETTIGQDIITLQ